MIAVTRRGIIARKWAVRLTNQPNKKAPLMCHDRAYGSPVQKCYSQVTTTTRPVYGADGRLVTHPMRTPNGTRAYTSSRWVNHMIGVEMHTVLLAGFTAGLAFGKNRSMSTWFVGTLFFGEFAPLLLLLSDPEIEQPCENRIIQELISGAKNTKS